MSPTELESTAVRRHSEQQPHSSPSLSSGVTSVTVRQYCSAHLCLGLPGLSEVSAVSNRDRDETKDVIQREIGF